MRQRWSFEEDGNGDKGGDGDKDGWKWLHREFMSASLRVVNIDGGI